MFLFLSIFPPQTSTPLAPFVKGNFTECPELIHMESKDEEEVPKEDKILPVQFPNSNSIQFLTLYVISFLLFYFNFGSVAALVSSMDGSGQTVKGHW